MYEARILGDSDRSVLDAFLLRYADEAMLLRGNLLLSGVEDRGDRFQGPYAGAFDRAGELRAVATHYAVGTVCAVADGPDALDHALRVTVARSGRKVTGVVSPHWIVQRAGSVLGLDGAEVQLDETEGLYALDLSQLRMPELLARPGIEVRVLRPEDRTFAVPWLLAYDVEALGATVSDETMREVERRFESRLAHGDTFVVFDHAVPCAMTAFNARLPERVQVGGVFTPPERRGRGYARSAVAASLAWYRARGVQRALLFTDDANVAAITAYGALGFERIGDFGLILFR